MEGPIQHPTEKMPAPPTDAEPTHLVVLRRRAARWADAAAELAALCGRLRGSGRDPWRDNVYRKKQEHLVVLERELEQATRACRERGEDPDRVGDYVARVLRARVNRGAE